ncbi:hypothetical protein DY218_26050 [Streptomyces triticagri]|uniref:DUF4232 domain-containing protein n=1 Tax=Streptomyces triticagri TaxID=2293568 RepID=A0A372LYL7_9ACTN|nr:hypothetical protein [Streptomyces triticagri]RFU83774.1 hypothetical protein DY218_26050 [Streptomyces triticagri]
MGSLRNPIGPLPSSIYWRRRAVLLSLLAVLALLIVWAFNLSGGGSDNGADGPNGKNPAPSITPGPSGSGPAISEQPGGRDESGDGGDGDGGGGDGSGDDGSGDGDGKGGSEDDGAGADSGKGGGGSGQRVPAGSSLPNCTPGNVKLTLRSIHNTYEPGEKPRLELVATNSAGNDCKADLGPKKAVLTITPPGKDEPIWSSEDCPSGAGSVLLRVPGEGKITQTFEWDGKPSAEKCQSPRPGSAGPGTYLVEVVSPDLSTARTSFVIEKA